MSAKTEKTVMLILACTLAAGTTVAADLGPDCPRWLIIAVGALGAASAVFRKGVL